MVAVAIVWKRIYNHAPSSKSVFRIVAKKKKREKLTSGVRFVRGTNAIEKRDRRRRPTSSSEWDVSITFCKRSAIRTRSVCAAVVWATVAATLRGCPANVLAAAILVLLTPFGSNRQRCELSRRVFDNRRYHFFFIVFHHFNLRSLRCSDGRFFSFFRRHFFLSKKNLWHSKHDCVSRTHERTPTRT